MGHPECRICHDPFPFDHEVQGWLTVVDSESFFADVCACTGSSRNVHGRCLVKWVTCRLRNTIRTKSNFLFCEVCTENYNQHKLMLAHGFELAKSKKDFSRSSAYEDRFVFAMFSVFGILLFLVSVAWVLLFLSCVHK